MEDIQLTKVICVLIHSHHSGECPVNCIFTTERKYLHSADALLFDTCLTGPTEYREV